MTPATTHTRLALQCLNADYNVKYGFPFELTKVQVRAIRERTVAMIGNVSDELAKPVAAGLGLELPRPTPRVMEPQPLLPAPRPPIRAGQSHRDQ